MHWKRWSLSIGLLIAVVLGVGCGEGRPSTDGLRASFAAQLEANPFTSNVQRNGDEITFSGPAPDGSPATWRIQIDSAVVESNEDQAYPYRGVVTSSWSADGQLVQPSGRESNLPVELTGNGLAQDCWALWNAASSRWEWE